MPKVPCSNCGELIYRNPARLKRYKLVACGNKCRDELHTKAVGSTSTDSIGYVYIKTNEGWRKRNRVNAANKLGRPLLDKEIVHHNNERKGDDNEENLVVTTQAEHMRLHGFDGRPGEQSNFAKITREQAVQIHDMRTHGATYKQMQKVFPIGRIAIWKVLTGHTWHEVYVQVHKT